MIRGIIFDCFGVLYRGSIAHLYELAPAANRAELANLSLSSDYGYVSHEEFLAQASALVSKTPAEIQAIINLDHVRNTAMIDYVRTFHPEYKVAMLSNIGRGVIDTLFTPTELTELFDDIILSSEVGLIKPDPNIFTLTAEKMGLPMRECVMIDDLVANIEGAQAGGMNGIVFTTTDQLQRDLTRLLNEGG
jgi:HAD superfamily hydrolase (TIGR01549 family)